MASILKIGSMFHIQWNDRGRIRRVTTRIRHEGRKRPPQQVEDLRIYYCNLESDLYHGIERPNKPVLVEDAMRDYLKDIENRHSLGAVSSRTVENARHRLPILKSMLDAQRISFLHDATYETCQRAMVAWGSRYAASTLEHFAHLLSATWNYKKRALKLKLDNPWHQRGVLPKVRKTNRAILSNEDWQILKQELEKAHPLVKFCITVSHYTGARLMAAANLREDDFNVQTHELTLAESKGKRLVHPCCQQLSRLLLDWPVQADHRYLPPATQNQLSARISCFFRHLRRKYPGRFIGISHHSLRRTYITRANAIGLPKQWSMDLVGHVREQTHDIYRQPIQETLRLADQRIADSWECSSV
ncbi:MAG: site-specific integrase [Caulobacteraceae bacterium]|nr:site-specific integrase [Caulobacteraceae bacterium]